MDPQGPALRELTVAPPGEPTALARIGREGRLRLAFERRGDRTVLTERRFSLPLQFLEPIPLADEAGGAGVTLLNPTGGVLGGDDLRTRLRVGEGAHVRVTTPSATRVYRSAGPPAAIDTRITVAAAATLEWLPDHLIPHPGAVLEQSLEIDLAAGARALVWEAFALGRVARGEWWSFARLATSITLQAEGRLVFLDRVALEPALGPLDPTGGFPYVGTLVAIGPGRSEALAAEIQDGGAGPGVALGASPLFHGGLVVRVLARTAYALEDTRTRLGRRLRTA